MRKPKLVQKERKPARKPVECIKHNTRSKPKRRSRGSRGENIGNYFGDTIVNAIKDKLDTIKSDYTAKKVAADKEYAATPQGQNAERRRAAAKQAAIDRAERLAVERSKYEQDLAKRQAWEQQPIEKRGRYPAPPVPREPETTLKEDWGAAKQYVTQGAKGLATPQGMYAVGKGAVNAGYKAGLWLEQKRQDEFNRQKDERDQRKAAWNDLTKEDQQKIREDQYLRKQMGQKLQQMRQQAFDYQMDKTDAYLSGRKFTPRVFKVESHGLFGESEDKYLDEYGRELPGIPEEVTRRSSSRSRRSETQDISNIFGLTHGGPIRSPLDEPPRRQMLPAEGDYDTPRQRRPRYAQEPPQYSQPQLRIVGSSAKREAADIRRLLM